MATQQKRKPAQRKPAPKRRSTPRSKAPPRRAQRSLLASRPALPRPVLEAHHVDIAALALIAIGVFLGGVAWAHWSGGALGEGAVRATRFVFGRLGYAVPAALVAAGALILARELRPPARPMRTGVICLVTALTLALAAGTLGLGHGPGVAHDFWRPAAFETRGGVLGQAELWVASHLLSNLGADILAVFLLIAGLILVSGATLAGALRLTGAGVVGT
ncbi:MAG: DNA translocase FtsK, partial [Actinomycetota bacterium]|nr:DNA translocase FtsK [Actinomycetota bacterium]